MQEIIIADTSCLILLTKINETDLLRQLFGTLYVTPEIAAAFGKPLPGVDYSIASCKQAISNTYSGQY